MRFRLPYWLIWLDDRVVEPIRDWFDVPTRLRLFGYQVKRYDVLFVSVAIAASIGYGATFENAFVGFAIGLLVFVLGWMIFEWIL